MDSSDHPSFLSLSRRTAQLAAQCRQIDQSFGRSQDPIDRLLEGTMQQDWSAVTEATRQIVSMHDQSSEPPLCEAVIRAAQALCEAIDGAAECTEVASKTASTRSHPAMPSALLGKLMEACRSQRLAQRRHFKTLGNR